MQTVETKNGIVTTEEEWRAYYAVTAILCSQLDPDRIAIRDGKHSCAILLDNNNRKRICRLYFNTAQKRVGLLDDHKVEELVPIEEISEIFNFAEQIKATARRYQEQDRTVPG